jgi:hypothetical protein
VIENIRMNRKRSRSSPEIVADSESRPTRRSQRSFGKPVNYAESVNQSDDDFDPNTEDSKVRMNRWNGIWTNGK